MCQREEEDQRVSCYDAWLKTLIRPTMRWSCCITLTCQTPLYFYFFWSFPCSQNLFMDKPPKLAADETKAGLENSNEVKSRFNQWDVGLVNPFLLPRELPWLSLFLWELLLKKTGNGELRDVWLSTGQPVITPIHPKYNLHPSANNLQDQPWIYGFTKFTDFIILWSGLKPVSV